MSNPLSTLPLPTLKVLAKMAKDAVAGRREELGQIGAEFEVDQTVVLRATGTVKVAKSSPDAVKAQSAEPWKLFAATLEMLNTEREAAGKVGIDLEQVIRMAEAADDSMKKRMQDAVKATLKRIKDEVRGFKWGGVSVPEGEVTVLAKEDHRPEAVAAS
jgi:uncharacterized protein YicC (UPF0701 family)